MNYDAETIRQAATIIGQAGGKVTDLPPVQQDLSKVIFKDQSQIDGEHKDVAHLARIFDVHSRQYYVVVADAKGQITMIFPEHAIECMEPIVPKAAEQAEGNSNNG